MWLIHLLSIFFITMIIGYTIKEHFTDILPLLFSLIILFLYVLSFVRHMSWIDGISVVLLIICAGWLFTHLRNQQISEFTKYVKREVTSGAFIWYILMILFITLTVSSKVVTWWDDYNFWATDLKSLFYLDGFASKYANVAPEFGDYPPGTQYLKWWVMHCFGNVFSEGKAFIGYYLFLVTLMLPLFRNLNGTKRFLAPILVPATWLLPGVAEIFGYEGFCSDLVMAFLYGAFLFSVIDKDNHTTIFYHGRMSIYLSVLVLCKSTGFAWAFFGAVFLLVCMLSWPKADRKISRYFYTIIPPAFFGGSWMLFCLLMRRVTRTTVTAVKYVTTDEYYLSLYTRDFMNAFIQAFFKEPLHNSHGGVINLSPFLYLLLVICVVVLFYKLNLFGDTVGSACLWFPIISGIIYYLIIFIAHVTIFANETQYLEPSTMVASIERYGAPFTIGMFLFLAMISMNHVSKQGWIPVLALLAFILLCTDYPAAWHGAISYRNDVASVLQSRQDMVHDYGEDFLEQVKVKFPDGNTRVLGLFTDDSFMRVRNTIVSFEASPVSTIFTTLKNAPSIEEYTIVQALKDSHASYVYIFPGRMEATELLNNLVDSGEFSYNTIYKIQEDNGALHLQLVP